MKQGLGFCGLILIFNFLDIIQIIISLSSFFLSLSVRKKERTYAFSLLNVIRGITLSKTLIIFFQDDSIPSPEQLFPFNKQTSLSKTILHYVSTLVPVLYLIISDVILYTLLKVIEINNSTIISPCTGIWCFVWTDLNPYHHRMIITKCGSYWSCSSGDHFSYMTLTTK